MGSPFLSVLSEEPGLCLQIVLLRLPQGGKKKISRLADHGITGLVPLQDGDGPVNLSYKTRVLFLIVHNKQLLHMDEYCMAPAEAGKMGARRVRPAKDQGLWKIGAAAVALCRPV